MARRGRYNKLGGGSIEGTIVELSDGSLLRNDSGVGKEVKSRFISRGTILKDGKHEWGAPFVPCESS